MSARLVLLDADTVGRGRTGDEAYTVELLRELPAAAPDLRFACSLRDPAKAPADLPQAVELLRLDVSSPYRRIPLSFPRLARRLRAHLVHVHYFVAPRLPCPAVVTVHDVSFARAPQLLRRRDRLLFRTFVPGSLRRARRIVTVSEFTRRELLDAYRVDPARVVAVPNGVAARFRPQPDAGAELERRLGLPPPFLLFVGALSPRKNVSALVDAYARASRDGVPQQLVLAGADRGARAAVQGHIAQHGLQGRVQLLGHVPDDVLPLLYAAADALVFPSLYEGFGLPALEAMACGTPVAASGTTGLGEAVGDAALTFDPCSADELASAIARVATDAPLRERLRAAGLRRAQAFSWRRSAERTAAVYRDALS